MASRFGSFGTMVRYSAQETVIVALAKWAVKQDRADLCLCIYSMADQAGMLSENFKLPQAHVRLIKAEYPTALGGDVRIDFSVEIEEQQ